MSGHHYAPDCEEDVHQKRCVRNERDTDILGVGEELSGIGGLEEREPAHVKAQYQQATYGPAENGIRNGSALVNSPLLTPRTVLHQLRESKTTQVMVLGTNLFLGCTK